MGDKTVQLGVTRDFLLATASDVYSKHVNDLMESAQTPGASVKEFDVSVLKEK